MSQLSSIGDADAGRTLGFLGATGIGVGAIVGGGILALAGVAFATTGPGALVAFALNGVIALLTALTFAEMATAFPESGGTYTFAKKVLSVEAAFMVGWVVWFASIVAAVLYALGFSAFAVTTLSELWTAFGGAAPAWLAGRLAVVSLALGAVGLYTWRLVRKSGGGGQWETVGKVVVFIVLILGGLWVLAGEPIGTVTDRLKPFFAAGSLGLLQAMGYTFIALQGFDLIAAVGGEVRDPERNIPRAMIVSLAIALVIYLPLLLVIATVGVAPGETITAASRANPETVVALAAEHFLGRVGFWLVMVAAVLSMLSALQANLLAASRVALAMARDHNLPAPLGEIREHSGTPAKAILATALTVGLILLVIPDVAAAGAVSSLIFLVSFTLAHWTNILTQRRGGTQRPTFRLPLFPLVPVVGGLTCLGLALFQGIAVPTAGALGAAWLALGGTLYLTIFARRARVADAAAEALDPNLSRLRGRRPLVLVPIANPASAESMVEVANALAPRRVGKVLLLSVVTPPREWTPGETPQELVYAQQVLGEALTASFAADLAPEALTTVSPHPWQEISRVSRLHGCGSVLLGMRDFTDDEMSSDFEQFLQTVDSDIVFFRAPRGWHLSGVRRILVPAGGRRDQSRLRARLLGRLCQAGAREITYLGVFGEEAPQPTVDRATRELELQAQDEAPGQSRVKIVRGSSVTDELIRRATESDLVVLGLRRRRPGRPVFGDVPVRVARDSQCPILMISRGG